MQQHIEIYRKPNLQHKITLKQQHTTQHSTQQHNNTKTTTNNKNYLEHCKVQRPTHFHVYFWIQFFLEKVSETQFSHILCGKFLSVMISWQNHFKEK